MGDFVGQQQFAQYAAAGSLLTRDPSSLTEIDVASSEQSPAITELVLAPTHWRVSPSCARFIFKDHVAFLDAWESVSPSTAEAATALGASGNPSGRSGGASESPFDSLEAASDPKAQAKALVTAFELVSKLAYRERLSTRVLSLVDAIAEEEAIEQRLVDSLGNMLQFLEANPQLRYPTIVLTPNRDFRALWRRGLDAHLAIEFTPDGDAVFVIFSRDPYKRGLIRRATGVASKEAVLDVLRPHRYEMWAAT